MQLLFAICLIPTHYGFRIKSLCRLGASILLRWGSEAQTIGDNTLFCFCVCLLFEAESRVTQALDSVEQSRMISRWSRKTLEWSRTPAPFVYASWVEWARSSMKPTVRNEDMEEVRILGPQREEHSEQRDRKPWDQANPCIQSHVRKGVEPSKEASGKRGDQGCYAERNQAVSTLQALHKDLGF